MKATLVTVVLTAMPALLAAQATGTSNGEVQTKVNVPSTYSSESRTKIETAFSAAHTKNLPDQILRDRLTEAQASNAAEADVVASIQKLESQLEVTQQALVQAGHQTPTADEVTSAATAMGHGLTAAQISALAKEAPADRSLVVSFNTLNKLAARGQPIDQALASVQAKLEAKATDDAIATLAGDAVSPAAAPAPSDAAAASPANAAKDSAASSAPKTAPAPTPAGVKAAPKPGDDSAKAAPKKPAADSAKAKPPVGKP
jgi:pilus assembly protein FimV